MGVAPVDAFDVGRETESLATAPPAHATARITSDRPTEIDPDAKDIPWAFVRGEIEGAPVGATLAIAVNGVVAGIAPTFRPGLTKPTEFWSTLDPARFRPGRNDIDVFLIGGPPAAPTLTAVRLPA